jgi:hypothetical protein
MSPPSRSAGSQEGLPTTADGILRGSWLLLASHASRQSLFVSAAIVLRFSATTACFIICALHGGWWLLLACAIFLHVFAFPRAPLWGAAAAALLVSLWIPVLGLVLVTRVGLDYLGTTIRRGALDESLREHGIGRSKSWRRAIANWAVGPGAGSLVQHLSEPGSRPDADELGELAVRQAADAWCKREPFAILRGVRTVFRASLLGESEVPEIASVASLDSLFMGLEVRNNLMKMSVHAAVASPYLIQLASMPGSPWEAGVFRVSIAFGVLSLTLWLLAKGEWSRNLGATSLVVIASLSSVTTVWAAAASVVVGLALRYVEVVTSERLVMIGIPSWKDARWTFRDLLDIPTLRTQALNNIGSHGAFTTTVMENSELAKSARVEARRPGGRRLSAWREIIDARACLESGNLALSEWHTQQALQLTESGDPGVRAESLLHRGLVLAEVGSLDEACEAVESAVEIFASRRSWRYRKANAQSELVRLYGLAGQSHQVMSAANACRYELARARAVPRTAAKRGPRSGSATGTGRCRQGQVGSG